MSANIEIPFYKGEDESEKVVRLRAVTHKETTKAYVQTQTICGRHQ